MKEARRRQSRAWREPGQHLAEVRGPRGGLIRPSIIDYGRNRPEVVEEFGRWLNSYAWSWYVTLTFREHIHPEQAVKRFREWTRRMERAAGEDVTWARALELQRRGVVHFHALLYWRRAVLPYAIAGATWRNVADGRTKIERYNPERGAAAYLGKYIAKGGEVDYGGPWWTPRAGDAGEGGMSTYG